MPKVGIDDVAVTESDRGTQEATLTVSLSEAAHDTVRVDVATVEQTAQAPSDFDAVDRQLTFAPGDTTKTVTVPVRGDTEPEPDETLLVRLSNPTRAKIVDAEGTVTIGTDPEPLIAIDDVRVIEDTTTARFTTRWKRPLPVRGGRSGRGCRHRACRAGGRRGP